MAAKRVGEPDPEEGFEDAFVEARGGVLGVGVEE
jgi:hypothetical protein